MSLLKVKYPKRQQIEKENYRVIRHDTNQAFASCGFIIIVFSKP